MTLPTSGTIAADQINLELARAGNAEWSMDGPLERLLAGHPTPQSSYGMDSFYGKSGGRNILTPGSMPLGDVGWSDGASGSLSPATVSGPTGITKIYTGNGNLKVFSPFLYQREHFTSILVNGQRFYTSNAQFTPGSRSTSWSWPVSFVFSIGQPVFVTID